MNRETLNKAYAEIYDFKQKLCEVLVDKLEDICGLDAAKGVISAFYSCRTDREFEIANDMLAAVCGWKFETLVQAIKDRDEDIDFEWECAEKEETWLD